MKVTAYGPASDPPFVPSFVVLDDGRVLRHDKADDPRAGMAVEVADGPMDVPDGKWVGIPAEGPPEIIDYDAQGPWRARAAEAAVRIGQQIVRQDALKAALVLAAGARLVGVAISSLIKSVGERRRPGEDLSQAFDRLRSSE